MLIQFNYKNFKSFKDDTTLDFSATRITEHSNRVVETAGEKMLTTAAIFGANASGKSNVIKAFAFMQTYVLDSFAYGGNVNEKNGVMRVPKCPPFLFDDQSKEAETSFEVYFFMPYKRGYRFYNYGFSLNENEITEEWLNVKAKSNPEYKSIFYRNGKTLDLVGIPQKNQENIRVALEKEALVVSLGAKLKIAELKRIRDWFYHNSFADFGDPIANAYMSRILPLGFVEDKSVQDNVVRFISAFDSSIIGFNVEILESDDEGTKRLKVESIHRMIGSDKTANLPLKQESDGTLKMFALYSLLQEVLESGGVLCIDELNARLHPLLVRNVLITFLNPEINTNHAQLIFTTHDAWQLSNNLLRRDEIWFTEKSSDGVSTLYSLSDFVDEDGDKIRKDENYQKNYLLGKYGAIPALKDFDMFREVKNGEGR